MKLRMNSSKAVTQARPLKDLFFYTSGNIPWRAQISEDSDAMVLPSGFCGGSRFILQAWSGGVQQDLHASEEVGGGARGESQEARYAGTRLLSPGQQKIDSPLCPSLTPPGVLGQSQSIKQDGDIKENGYIQQALKMTAATKTIADVCKTHSQTRIN